MKNEFLISAAWRSSGKTLVTTGLARAVLRRQQVVSTFKKGPDYIDPLWLAAAAKQPCYNLDSRVQSIAELRRTYSVAAESSDLALVEGTMGLHDGVATDGSDCNAAIARLLGLPVILVLDCRGMHRSVAALVNGVVQFDPEINFAGVLLNRVRSERHGQKIQCAIEQYCDVKLLGMIPETSSAHIEERELGLVPAPGHPLAEQFINGAADLIESSCDLDSLLQESVQSPAPGPFKPGVMKIDVTHSLPRNRQTLRIGIARDEAFHFYYQDDLDELVSKGVELVEFSPIRDQLPGNLDGLLLGGGFPERHAEALSANRGIRDALAAEIRQGLPVHAECGGLMYLCRSLPQDGQAWPMVGAIAADVKMCKKPRGRGYMQLIHNSGSNRCSATELLNTHEFHHSEIVFDASPTYAYTVKRGHGVDGNSDGVCIHNVVASYAHFRHTSATPWIDWFLQRVAAQQCQPQEAIR